MTKLQEILAWNMKRLRQINSLSQTELADKVGTAASYISQIERGLRFPSPPMLEKIASVLNVPDYELFLPTEIDGGTMQEFYSKLRKQLLKALNTSFKEV